METIKYLPENFQLIQNQPCIGMKIVMLCEVKTQFKYRDNTVCKRQ
jgi:hypothetical protein